ncbi:DUF2834 domain-containing protein [Alkalicoccobacillus porphyridii]|uniref:DUF2834 domain-containing protein n=1 Tax=Alkalicoccobacillus porphyridii TaxID=2597270 RepID=A0A554A279_9BACI|nr:DUF2834 domain-containing protein [Alkalicoccobacillus porphyridii]TSB47799.1 DUF2834 domain-containing protein [Alkalicoccobacillus porphyridii]
MKIFYGLLCIVGTILPYSQLLPWLYNYGFNLQQFISEISHSKMGAFAWWDVIISIIVLIGFILYEGKQKGMNHLWLPIIATCTVGVSLGLPFFLLLRQIHIEKQDVE